MANEERSLIPEHMVLDCVEIAQEQAKELSNDDAVDYVRQFASVIVNDLLGQDIEDAAVVAFQALTAAALFQELFIKAYGHAEERVSAIEQLQRMYDK